MWSIASFVLLAIVSFLLGTLTEYVMHRVMHKGGALKRRHAEHHRNGIGQGVLHELRDYVIGGLVADVWIVGALLWWCDTLWPALGFASGVIAHMLLAAYAHQVQHERPALIFWMPRPVHHLHHHHNQWHHNFGISTDIWDRVFGTYDAKPWRPERRPFEHSAHDFLNIRWR